MFVLILCVGMGLGRGGEWFLTPQGGDKKKTARGGQNKIGR